MLDKLLGNFPLAFNIAKYVIKGILEGKVACPSSESQFVIAMNPNTAHALASDPWFAERFQYSRYCEFGDNLKWGVPDKIGFFRIVVVENVKRIGPNYDYSFPNETIMISGTDLSEARLDLRQFVMESVK